jgi:PAS domain S-box-containing protein
VLICGIVSVGLTYTPHHGTFPDLPLQLMVFAAIGIMIIWLNVYRVQTGQALEQSEQRLARVVQTNMIGVIIADLNGKVIEANDAYLRMIGYTRRDVEQGLLRWDRLTPPEYDAQDAAVIERLRTQGSYPPFEKEYFRKDGSRVPILVGAAMIGGPHEEAVCFVLDLTERRRIEAERVAITREKDDFLVAVAHDLKGPLTTIKGVAQLLQRRLARPDSIDLDKVRSGAQTIDRTASRMVSAIDELLDAARIDMGRPLDLTYAAVDLVSLVRDIAAEYEGRGTGHRVIVGTEAPELMGVVDAVRVERVLRNLLDNAVKYSPDCGEVLVCISGDEAGDGVITIRDRGVGIPAADLPHIFDRFRRGSNVGSIAGTGVGLAGVKQIVDQHGGSIAVESCEGEGTRVTLHLPLTPREAETGLPLVDAR